MDMDGPKESAYKRCMKEQCSFCASEGAISSSSLAPLAPVFEPQRASGPPHRFNGIKKEDCSQRCRYQEQLHCEKEQQQVQERCETVQEPKLVCKERIRVPTELLSDAINAAAQKQGIN